MSQRTEDVLIVEGEGVEQARQGTQHTYTVHWTFMYLGHAFSAPVVLYFSMHVTFATEFFLLEQNG